MPVVGPDGNDLPVLVEDGVTGVDWMAINARVFTAYQREAFDLNFGLGLAHGLGDRSVPLSQLRTRLEASFQGTHLDIDSVELSLGGRSYLIDLSFLVENGE